MKEAKEACRKEYDRALAAALEDAGGRSAPPAAAVSARAALDKADARILEILAPQPPLALEQLPIRGMVGHWTLGRGPLATAMHVRYSEDGSLAGALDITTGMPTANLKTWQISTDGHGKAVLHATFSDGHRAMYERIPSFPDEMDFINTGDPFVQRLDLKIEDDDLIIRCVQSGGNSAQLRFSRQVGSDQD
jgi:hypothetical protein